MKLTVLLMFFLLAFAPLRQAQTTGGNFLNRQFSLAGEHSPETQYFIMESQMITYALNGVRQGVDIFRLYLKCTPAKLSGKAGDEYTCMKFTVQLASSPEVEIPSLKGWSYMFNTIPTGMDEKGQVFGIDHAKFNSVTDANGKAVPLDKAYHVYNAFIDFHAITGVFTEKAYGGKGIQDLTAIGQKIVHAAANSEAPVNLGENIEKGSIFKNGLVTLEFKGLSLVNGKECALIEYDSGESSFKMKMRPMPEMVVNTVGSSHYKGDIYKDLAGNWVQKANLFEMVVSETDVPSFGKVNSVIERSITIKNVDEKEMPGLD